MANSVRSLFYRLARLLALPWRLATHQPSPPTGPARRKQGSPGLAEEEAELGLYLLR